MKKVVRYECKWCGHLFRTPNRHKCRFDPAWHNCLSCAHCGKFETVTEEDWSKPFNCVSDGVFAPHEITTMGFHCNHDDIGVGEGGYNDFPTACGQTKCPDWELLPGYTGTKSFAKHQRELEEHELKPEVKDEHMHGELQDMWPL